MRLQYNISLLRIGSLLALGAVLAGCTKGGQFDPTTLLDTDMFANKKSLQGQREPVFPNGVPGATTGIPPDLVKGYQPPPEPLADNGNAAIAAAASTAEPAKPKPKLKHKPKPKLARAPASPPRTEISIGLAKPAKPPTQQQAPPSQSPWPAPAQTAAQPSQSIWPAPPPMAPAQSAPQPSQSIWPNPPAPGASSQ